MTSDSKTEMERPAANAVAVALRDARAPAARSRGRAPANWPARPAGDMAAGSARRAVVSKREFGAVSRGEAAGTSGHVDFAKSCEDEQLRVYTHTHTHKTYIYK